MERGPRPLGAREVLRFVRDARAYDDAADRDLLRRTAGLLFAVLALGVAGAAVFDPLDAHGATGWIVAGGCVGWCAALAALLLSGRSLHPRTLVALSCWVLLGLGALDHFAGGDGTYESFLVVVVIFTAATQPASRSAAVLLVALGALVAGSPRDEVASELVTNGVAWSVLAALGLYGAATTRLQRAILLHERGLHAELARVDPLTGLGNRRAFDAALEAETSRSRRTGEPLSLVVLDLDDFKTVNDAHGHLAGDAVLRGVAGVLRSHVRRPDCLFRWGGDELCVLLPGADEPGARRVAERLVAEIGEEVPRPEGGPMRVTAGVARWSADDDRDLVDRADADLRARKAARRAQAAQRMMTVDPSGTRG